MANDYNNRTKQQVGDQKIVDGLTKHARFDGPGGTRVQLWVVWTLVCGRGHAASTR